jgi:hypothetical protein
VLPEFKKQIWLLVVLVREAVNLVERLCLFHLIQKRNNRRERVLEGVVSFGKPKEVLQFGSETSLW